MIREHPNMIIRIRDMDVMYMFLSAMELALDIVPCFMDISADNILLTGDNLPRMKATMGTMVYMDCSVDRLAASTLMRSCSVEIHEGIYI
jgi:hypothetical protein